MGLGCDFFDFWVFLGLGFCLFWNGFCICCVVTAGWRILMGGGLWYLCLRMLGWDVLGISIFR